MTTVVVGTIATSVPGHLVADVNNASRLAGGSLFALTVDLLRTDYAHLLNSDLVADLRLAEAGGWALRLYQRMGFVDVARETEWRRRLLPDRSPATPGAGA